MFHVKPFLGAVAGPFKASIHGVQAYAVEAFDVRSPGEEEMSANPVAVHVATSLSRIELSEQDILSRLTNTEDSTVERKTASDYRDCLKAAVAFSNSLPVDDPGIIFVGVRNDGTVQDNSLNLDSLERKVSEEIRKVYPPIYAQMKVMKDGCGKEFLAVIVRGSAERPHFSGPSYVRDGMQTKEASEQQFQRLIAERNSKVREILKWKGSQISLQYPPYTYTLYGTNTYKHRETVSAHILDCNRFYVNLQVMRSEDSGSQFEGYPLAKVEVSFDPKGAGRLCLVITD